MPVKGRPRLVSHQANTTKLFVDDRREVIALSTSEKKCISDVIRELVHEALRVRRHRAFGRDEGENFIRDIHRETIAEGINPVIAELADLRQKLETFSSPSEQAILAIVSHILSHVMISEHVAKVLARIAMQKDNLTPDQVKAQLATQNHAGALQAKTITEKILAQYALALSVDANQNPENVQ